MATRRGKASRGIDLASEAWRLFPHTYAVRTTNGLWRPYNWLVYLSNRLRATILRGGGRVLVNAPPRQGKQIADFVEVLTVDGWKTHGDLKPGDQVFGPDGKPAAVVAVSEKTEATLDVELTNGEVVTCHPNHEWTVWDKNGHCWRTVETRWFLQDVTRGPCAGGKRKLWSGQRGRRGGRAYFQLPEVQAIHFPEQNLPMDPYVLGVWLGDGTSDAPCITMSAEDGHHVVPAFESAGFRLTATWVHKDTKVPTFSFGGGRRGAPSRLTVALRDAGVWCNKHIPQDYLVGSIEQRLALLAGLIDSDGHVEAGTGRASVSTGKRHLCDQIRDLCSTLGFRPYVTKQDPVLSSSGIQGTQVIYTVAFQPMCQIPTRLPRKQIVRIAPQRRIGIADVRPATQPAQGHCIQVDRPDGLYLVGRTLVPTHNSEFISKHLPSWFLGMFPEKSVIICSAESGLAEDYGRATRDHFVKGAETWTKVREDASAAKRWMTTQGGTVITAGVGGSIIGRGAHLLILDDPYANWDDANSPSNARRLRDWFNSTFYTRTEPDATIIVLHQRWSEIDLTEYLLKEHADKWEHICLPAICEDEDDPLGRQIGEALCPERFDEEALARIRASTTELIWSSLYQQRPAPAEGSIWKRHWWRFWHPPGQSMPPVTVRLEDGSYMECPCVPLPIELDAQAQCLPAGTQIMTNVGPVPVEQVKAGDQVWSLDEASGTFRLARVWRAECSGEDTIYRFETQSRTLRASSNHRILVRRKFSAPRGGPGGYKGIEWRNIWVHAKEVQDGDYIVAVKELPTQGGEVAPNGRRLTEEFMAFIGLYLGDGNFNGGGVTITRHPDAPYGPIYRGFAEREFKSFGNGKHPPRPVRVREHGYRMTFASVAAVSELKELGLGGYSHTKRVPPWIFSLKPGLILAFLRGYLDSDGAVNTRGHIIYSSVNPLLLEDIRHLCMMVGVPAGRVCRFDTAGQYTVMGRSINRRDMHQIFLANVEANRKIGAHHPEKNRRLWVAPVAKRDKCWSPRWSGNGTEASKIGLTWNIQGAVPQLVKKIIIEPPEPVYDLGVEETNTFIADGIVVHNSWDMTFKDSRAAAYVVGQVWGARGAERFLLDQVRARMDLPATIEAVRQLSAKWPGAIQKIIEDAANGPAVVQSIRQEVQGLVLASASSELGSSKEARANAAAPMIKAGNVYLPHPRLYSWVDAFINECAKFPNSRYKDQVDAAGQALLKMRSATWKPVAIRSPNRRSINAPRTNAAAQLVGGFGGPGSKRTREWAPKLLNAGDVSEEGS